MPSPHSILVPVANPDTAAQLVHLGARLAERLDDALVLLHVTSASSSSERTGEPDDEARAILDQARSHAETYDVPVETRFIEAPTVVEALIRASQDPHVEYLIMGWRGEFLGGKTKVGSNIDAVVKESGCQTIVMQQGEIGRSERVLVPVANPHAAPLALIVAALLRGENGAAVTVLHLAPLPLSEKEREAFRSALFALIEMNGRESQSLLEDASQVELLFEVQEDPARELALHSGFYDRMILGTSRDGYADGAVFAAFQLDIARKARCPVVFVRPSKAGARFNY